MKRMLKGGGERGCRNERRKVAVEWFVRVAITKIVDIQGLDSPNQPGFAKPCLSM
jgi:hypothetical protein